MKKTLDCYISKVRESQWDNVHLINIDASDSDDELAGKQMVYLPEPII